MKTIEPLHRPACSSYVRLGLAVAGIYLLTGDGSGLLDVLAQGNPISVENAQTGDTDFGLGGVGSGDPTIQGFATSISVNRGETVDFKVNTPSTNYKVDIYRLGYYRGAGARKVATVLPSVALPQIQPACLADGATGLVDCGNWTVSASWPSTGAVSGIYIGRLARIDTGGASHMVFIVRDDERKADVLVQTSDSTWQAYNRYGGASTYCAPAGIGVSNTGTAYATGCPNRATKVSYNRPFDTRAHDARSFLFGAEYPMVRWLEANGYNVKYWTGVDTDRRGADLVNPAVKPKAFLSVGHDEYWSGDQRTRIETARTAGVHLGFFSGNEMFWKTRYEPSIDGSATPYRTLVTYKETLAGAKIDPAVDAAGHPIWTGAWRDPRFSPPADGSRPENGVTGTSWTVDTGTAAITVPASMAGLRVWQNTRVAALTSGVATFSPQTLGYEWDEDLDNGARPAGLMHLSSTTVSGVLKIGDYGSTTGPGTATHNLTLYRHASGALVFGAGTIQWSWGLDATHDGGAIAPDQAMQQATITLLADMGAQPTTLQIGANPSRPLIATAPSSDFVAPTSAITTPEAGAHVQSGNLLTITGTTIDAGGIVAGVEVSVDGGVTWHAAQGTSTWTFDWSPGARGAATIRSRAVDDSGNIETPGPGVTVLVVAGSCPCTTLWKPSVVPDLVSTSDPNAVEVGVKFMSETDGFIIGIRFYKGPTNVGTHIGNLWTISGALLAAVTFTGETPSGWQQANFSMPVNVKANTTYVASYHTNVGRYSSDGAYFTNAGVDSPPLHALPSNPSGGNGVYRYGPSAFPSSSFNAQNYYVDVSFAETIIDSTPLVISDFNARANDGSTAVVTWTTTKGATSNIEYSTDPGFPPDLTFTATNEASVKQHSLTLIGLTPNATYYFAVSSADRDGNFAMATAPGFTVPGPTLHDTSAEDFLAGAHDATTYIAQTADGEVILKPASGAEFSGSVLPPGWIAVPFGTVADAAAANGVLPVDGARVASCVTDANGACLPETLDATPSAIYSAPHTLEFAANFSGDKFQHAGLAQTLWTESEQWAIFSTANVGSLSARTNLGGAIIETPLSIGLLGSPHRFRIDWRETQIDYYVDDVAVASHALRVPLPGLRPIAGSDFNIAGGRVLVDWMRMSPYAATGTFESRVFDALSIVNWNSVYWKSVTPAGTNVAISVRTGNTPTPEDGTWRPFVAMAAPGPFSAEGRYVQYRAALASTDADETPALEDVIITTAVPPVAVNDAKAINQDTSYTFPAGSLTANDTDADTPHTQLRIVAVAPPAYGVATLNGNGSVTYAPAPSFTGIDSFTYTVSDGLLTATATVSMEVGAGTGVTSDTRANTDTAVTAPGT